MQDTPQNKFRSLVLTLEIEVDRGSDICETSLYGEDAMR